MLTCFISLLYLIPDDTRYNLQLTFFEGQSWKLAITSDTLINLPQIPTSTKFATQASVEFTIHRIDDQGNIEMIHLMTDANEEGDVRILSQLQHGALLDIPIYITLNSQYDFISAKAKQSLNEPQTQALDLLRQSLKENPMYHIYPREPVAIGDTWDVDMPILLEGDETKEAYLKGTSTFEGSVQENGQEYWRITFELEVLSSVGGVTADGTTRGALIIRKEDKLLHRLETRNEEAGEVDTPNGMLTLNATTDVEVKLTEAKPVR